MGRRVGAAGRAVGAVVVTRCDKSRKAEPSGPISSWVGTSLATMEERSWPLMRSSGFSLRNSESWVLTASCWAVMATMPETVAQRTERMDPLPAVMVWSASGERSWTRSGFNCRLFLVCEKISARKARVGDGCAEGEGEGGS